MRLCGCHCFLTDGHFISFGICCLNAKTTLKISLLRQHFSFGICRRNISDGEERVDGGFCLVQRCFISVGKSCLIARKDRAFNVAFLGWEINCWVYNCFCVVELNSRLPQFCSAGVLRHTSPTRYANVRASEKVFHSPLGQRES